jgi:response regulator RpfG family c-di-GMP phosphodiesterase
MRASPAGRGRRFGREFRIVCESAADAGLAALRELAVRRVPVALLVVGQDLSGMSGVAFLGRAHDMHPQAVRVLLVERDYSARSPIVAAMTLGQADSHITKPWMLRQRRLRLNQNELVQHRVVTSAGCGRMTGACGMPAT